MKNPLFVLILLTCGGALGLPGAFADDATTLQVAPSDQIVYPDASQVLNKTSPAAPPTPAPAPAPAPTGGVPTNKPLVAAAPVRASTPVQTEARGWYLQWTFAAPEASVRAWAAGLGRHVTVVPAPDGQWLVLQGPLDPGSLGGALDGQFGKAVLVRR